MRKFIVAATLTLALTAPTALATPRDRDKPRDPETPMTRIVRLIKHLITTGGPSVPLP
jgi:hypothetical protein